MSRKAMYDVYCLWLKDVGFRKRLTLDAKQALAEFNLTDQEQEAIIDLNMAQGHTLRRSSKFLDILANDDDIKSSSKSI
jgi:hypothetical protein